LANDKEALIAEKEALYTEARVEFVRLNQVIEVMQNEVVGQQNRFAQLTTEATTAERQRLAEFDNLVAAQARELATNILAEERSKLAEHRQAIEDHRRLLDDIFVRALADKETQLAEKEALILNQARAEIELLQRQLQEKNLELEAKNDQIADSDNQLTERILQSIEQLAERDRKISVLHDEIASLTVNLVERELAVSHEAAQPSHDLTLTTQLAQQMAEASREAAADLDNELSKFVVKCKGERKEDFNPEPVYGGPSGLGALLRWDPESDEESEFLSPPRGPHSPNPDLPPDYDEFLANFEFEEGDARSEFNPGAVEPALAPLEPVAEQFGPKGKGKRLAETESDEERRRKR
jgi:chromosome segregation ATPase